MIRTINELLRLKSFGERYEYLRLEGSVGEATFGFDRYLNQMLYRSREWLRTRDLVIIRDDGCDLAMPDFPIKGRVIVHHMNPISIEDIERHNSDIISPDFLVCVSHNTHLAIHYSNKFLLPGLPIERRPGDTVPWRQERRSKYG
jgi:hypothetical protein